MMKMQVVVAVNQEPANQYMGSFGPDMGATIRMMFNSVCRVLDSQARRLPDRYEDLAALVASLPPAGTGWHFVSRVLDGGDSVEIALVRDGESPLLEIVQHRSGGWEVFIDLTTGKFGEQPRIADAVSLFLASAMARTTKAGICPLRLAAG